MTCVQQIHAVQILLALAVVVQYLPLAVLEEGVPCTIQDLPGNCTAASKCYTLEMAIESNMISARNIPSCGLNTYEEVICCPIIMPEKVSTYSAQERPAIRACREIEKNAELQYEPQIAGGVLVEQGEFPHAAALGFPRIGNETGYLFRCGGSLIAPRFVLTAAHCINSLESQPTIVRMGTLNIYKPDANTVDIRVKDTHVHPNYTSSYNDIGLVELVDPVSISSTVKMVCLHTDADVMPRNPVSDVIGWGYINANQDTTDVLLKARVKEVDITQCNATYAAENLLRAGALEEGILETQLCALDPLFKADACPGDSGGPLNVLVDPTRRLYRVIGVVSKGGTCGTKIPGIYTRVSAYLDYIEKIVWPIEAR